MNESVFLYKFNSEINVCDMVANTSPQRRQRYRDPFEKLVKCNQIWIKFVHISVNVFMSLHLGNVLQ